MTGSTGDCSQNQIISWVKIEDMTGLCLFPPATMARKFANRIGLGIPLFNEGDQIDVALSLTGIRGDDRAPSTPTAGPRRS